MSKILKYAHDRYNPPGEWVISTLKQNVAGVKYRISSVRDFCNAVKKAEKLNIRYGLRAIRDPENQFDCNAIEVHGYSENVNWLGKKGEKTWHIGYFSRDLAKEINDYFVVNGINFEVQLYAIYENEDFIDISFFVLGPPGHSHKKRTQQRSLEQE